eukprot:evm.model.scf_45.6 EVM.evm.TU.scf_45.6   scf_45:102519-103996(+)
MGGMQHGDVGKGRKVEGYLCACQCLQEIRVCWSRQLSLQLPEGDQPPVHLTQHIRHTVLLGTCILKQKCRCCRVNRGGVILLCCWQCYKHVCLLLEKSLRRSEPEDRLPYLLLLSGILTESREIYSTHTKYSKRLKDRMGKIFTALEEGPEDHKLQVMQVLDTWAEQKIFPASTLQSLRDTMENFGFRVPPNAEDVVQLPAGITFPDPNASSSSSFPASLLPKPAKRSRLVERDTLPWDKVHLIPSMFWLMTPEGKYRPSRAPPQHPPPTTLPEGATMLLQCDAGQSARGSGCSAVEGQGVANGAESAP